MITVLEGQDEFRISEKISEFRLTISPSEMTDINTTTLDGDSVTIGELISSLSTVPFMADRRLVIVGGLLNRLGKSSEKNKPEWSDLARLLVGIPDTATLLLVEKESPPTNKFISEILKHVTVEKFPQLRYRELLDWIKARCSKLGIEMESQAISLIADSVGNNLRLLDSELKKVKIYSRGNLITWKDVKVMVPYVRQQNVFRVVDAVIEGRARDALSASSVLISQGESPTGVMRMIERQLRFLIQAKYLLNESVSTADIGKHINLSGYPLRKTLEMEKKISQGKIMDMHEKLLESNIRVREGRLTEQESFALLISELH
ncbi:DNA polymerase III subunit delta [Chloroflexi bacterium]|nr:DNA polymerase III subunit delta [Chloroflexota bacterium]